jgi:uncharacterized cupredoxin-like copper-binding protein
MPYSLDMAPHTSKKRRAVRRSTAITSTSLAMAVLMGCGNDATPTQASSTPTSAAPTPVPVKLTDFTIGVPATLGAGAIAFDVTNTSGNTTHELVVIRTDLPGGNLPVDEHGAVDEKGSGIEFVDEREDIEAGKQVDLPVTLSPGKYVLVCNLLNHYALGMWTELTVTGDAPATTTAVTVSESERADALAGLTKMQPLLNALVADVLTATDVDASKLTAQLEAIDDVWFGFEETIRHDDVTAYLDMEDELQALERAVEARDATKAAAAVDAFDQLADAYRKR